MAVATHPDSMPSGPYDTVFINGTVGAGKSTVADEVSKLSSLAGIPNAVIDLDDIRRSWPSPADDWFNHELELRNLASLVVNYRSVGARRFILAGVLEQRSEIVRYRSAVQSTGMLICRLTASPDLLLSRLAQRHHGDHEALEWHSNRVGELTGILDVAGLDDAVFDTSACRPADVARAIHEAAEWSR